MSGSITGESGLSLLSQNLSPKDVVQLLDEHVVGQVGAKRALAISIVNRRRKLLVQDNELARSMKPNNILLAGPTGTGKTALLECVAKMYNAPFVKADATRFTEVGYYGRDVESVIYELVDKAYAMEQASYLQNANEDELRLDTEKKVVRAILDAKSIESTLPEEVEFHLQKLRNDEYKDMIIEVEIPEQASSSTGGSWQKGSMDFFGGSNSGHGFSGHASGHGNGVATIGIIPFGDVFKAFGGDSKKIKRMRVEEALTTLINIAKTNIDNDKVVFNALKNAATKGIIFIDEIDKIISQVGHKGRGEVSREGVQRDLITMVEGTTVSTKYGNINTDHILFVVAGAFHTTKPADLLPELRGRFPIEAQMKALTVDDFVKILTVPKYNILLQIKTLLKASDINLNFTEDGILAMAEATVRLNFLFENTGARRLFSVVENVVEEISFNSVPSVNEGGFIIDRDYVNYRLTNEFAKKRDKKDDFII